MPVQVQMQQIVDTIETTTANIDGEIPAPTTVVALPDKKSKARPKSKNHRWDQQSWIILCI